MVRVWRTACAVVGMTAGAASLAAQETIDRGLSVTEDARLKIWLPAGSLRLTGWDRDSVHVRGVIGDGRLFLGGSRGAWKITIEGDAAEDARGEIEIRLPRGAQVSAKTVTATILVADVTGWFTSVSGDVIVEGRSRRLEAETLDGDVSVAGQIPWLSARTGSGAIKLEGRFGDVRASSVSGAISILNKLVDRGRFESVTGDIRYRGRFAPGGDLLFDSHGGSVTLVLPTTVAGTFHLTSIAGRIDNQFSADQPLDRPEGAGQELEFSRGSDGPRVTVRSFKGSIRLREEP